MPATRLQSHDPGPLLADRVARLTGRRPIGWESAPAGGFTRATRVIAHFADGGTAFVKAATDDLTTGWIRDEIAVYRHLRAPFAPAVFALDESDPPLIVLEDLRAGYWPPPWRPGDVEAVLATLAAVRSTPPPPDLPSLAGWRESLASWRHVAAEPAPFLALGLCSPRWLERALPDLLAADETAPLEGDELLHLDVRGDNLCLGLPNRPAILVDWNHSCRGNAELDPIGWLPSLYRQGGPPPDAVAPDADGRLVAFLAGFWAWRAPQPPPSPDSTLRALQADVLRVTLPWAAARLGLAPPDGPATPPSTAT
ncbi:MAG: hypothetical protein QOF01_5210 [Thermomicrobiales bacterium]|nr:hypothetical protein [Thermomicrobiales bacterium]